ncbi:unnamed protein product [Malus baccata var. baccata]
MDSNSPFADTKVFVGGFAWETHSDAIGRYFDQFGQFLEVARADPTPIINGRCANCSLASLWRSRPPMPYGRPRPASPYIGGMQATRGAYTGGYGYQQPLSYNYQQRLVYPPYGYATYGPEYAYSQGGYPTVYGYTMHVEQIIQFGAPSVNEVTISTVPPVQAAYHRAPPFSAAPPSMQAPPVSPYGSQTWPMQQRQGSHLLQIPRALVENRKKIRFFSHY